MKAPCEQFESTSYKLGGNIGKNVLLIKDWYPEYTKHFQNSRVKKKNPVRKWEKEMKR